MATPDFIRELRVTAGQQLLWMPGVAAVVFDDAGRVLLGRRADSGRWTVIGGIPEPGEQPADCAVREVFEETAVHCVPERVAHVRAMPPHTFPNGDTCQFMDITMVCRAVGGTARVNDDESLEVAWFALDALPELSPHEALRIEHARTDGPTWFQPARRAPGGRGSMTP
ncbi:NUDIX domain-containing protein [Nocardia sp. NPDC048505]|uniref:NUDIX hydrolase n=1 Tax=unclassified Nocardia TaxID=2637762 RepID=UPI0033F74C5C